MRDALGSTIGMVDSTGAINTSYTYEPFGNTTVSGPNANPHQFIGRENADTGMYFYRARYYSPTLQRFVAQDLIGFAGGDPNLYGYVVDSPLTFIDPFSLDCTGSTGGFVGMAVGYGLVGIASVGIFVYAPEE